ncbi:MAG: hypothetical protein NT031_05220, partial [Planctomycetota bacterium]|nr:hypothetical protein [Planctomycetota bacterium]
MLLYRMCEDATECLIYLMLVFSPWAFGSTQSWAIWTMSIAGYLLGLLLITKLSLRWFKGYPAARWSRVPGAHDSNRPSHLHGAAGIHAVLAFLTVCILGFCLVSALNARATYRSEQVSFEYHQC